MSDLTSTPEPPALPVIEASGLARWYGSVIALTNLEVQIPPGITGLLGPNGAGKSTFLRLVTGQIQPSEGSVRVFGKNPVERPDVFHELGFCSEHDVLFEDMTPRHMLTFLARTNGYRKVEARERAERAMETTGIAHAADRRCRGFSKGMRQRVRIAAGILHDPKLLLLDEPMTGLDPVGRKAIVDLVMALRERGTSVVFSSHILHEVEAVAEHVVVVARGMLLAEGSLGHIQEQMADYDFTLEVRASEPRRLAERLVMLDHVKGLTFEDDQAFSVASISSQRLMRELPALALELGVRIEEMDCPGDSLESLFQRLIHR